MRVALEVAAAEIAAAKCPACGAWKRANYAFCARCNWLLPPAIAFELMGAATREEAYGKALEILGVQQ